MVSGVLWRTLPFVESERLVMVGTFTPSSREPGGVRSAMFLDLQRQVRTLDAIAAGAFEYMTVVDPGEPTPISCFAVTPRFFDVLGVKPALGRAFTKADYDAAMSTRPTPGGPRPAPAVVLLNDGLWRRRFGGERGIVGSDLRVAGGARVEVIGVMPPETEAIGRAMPGQCWVPDVPDAAEGLWRPRFVVGRLAAGRSLAEANAELDVLGANLGRDSFTNEPQALRAMGMLDRIVGRAQTQLVFLFGAVVCVLLVTCANVVNLFLAHAAGRRDELATRVALGASRLRLVRQLLTESLVISLLGGALGFLLAVWGVPVLVALAPPDTPRLQQISVDWSTFTFTLLVSSVIGILCGLVASMPARQVPKTASGTVHGATPRATRFRRGVAVGEIALALMLAVAATLMVRTVRALNAIDLGFDATAVVSADLESTVDDMSEAQDRQSAIIERVKDLPGVRAAGIGLGPLAGGMFIGGLVVPDDGRKFDMVRVDAVSPGYFEALGARLKAGRLFHQSDTARDAPARILVNESAARAFWRGADPMGRTVVINGKDHLEVIGVIADIRGSSLEQVPGPAIYQLSHQSRNFSPAAC